MYLNIPIQCPTIYEKIIEKLQKCKSGIDLGHPDLGQGCLIEVSNTIKASFRRALMESDSPENLKGL